MKYINCCFKRYFATKARRQKEAQKERKIMRKRKQRISKFQKSYKGTPLLKRIELGLRDVQLIREGRMKAITLEELLSEL